MLLKQLIRWLVDRQQGLFISPLCFTRLFSLNEIKWKPRSLNAPFTQSDLPIFPMPAPLCSQAYFCSLCAHLSLVCFFFFSQGTNSLFVFVLTCIIIPFFTQTSRAHHGTRNRKKKSGSSCSLSMDLVDVLWPSACVALPCVVMLLFYLSGFHKCSWWNVVFHLHFLDGVPVYWKALCTHIFTPSFNLEPLVYQPAYFGKREETGAPRRNPYGEHVTLYTDSILIIMPIYGQTVAIKFEAQDCLKCHCML